MLKRLKEFLAGCVILATLLMLAGCGPRTEPIAGKWQTVITDDTKTTVTLTAKPKRIVSLSPSLTEVLFALGLGDRVVGVTSWDDYPPEVKEKPVVGDLRAGAEAVLAQNPDLVLASSLNMATVDTLRLTEIPVLVFDPESMEDIFHTIERVAKATGADEKGRELIGKMRRALKEITASLPVTDRVTVFIEVGWDPLFTTGSGTFLHDITTIAGGQNIAKDVTGWVRYSTEEVLAKNPDVIITTTGHGTDPVGSIKKRPGWDRIRAVREGRIVVLDPNLVYRPGPRSILLVQELVRNLYPTGTK